MNVAFNCDISFFLSTCDLFSNASPLTRPTDFSGFSVHSKPEHIFFTPIVTSRFETSDHTNPALNHSLILGVMPRRPSGSVLHALGSPNRGQQLHKATESRPTLATTSMASQNSSAQTLGQSSPLATPQQKVVHVLVNRLKNKVPISTSCLFDGH